MHPSSVATAALAAALGLGCQGILDIDEGTRRPEDPVSFLSCVGLAPRCGPDGNEDCCTAAAVFGGSFYRSYDGFTYDEKLYMASLDNFTLDRFEVTVGRFRKFVEAYPASRPRAGSGKNPNNAKDAGWDPAWNPGSASTQVPYDRESLLHMLSCSEGTWTDAPGANENLPITCIPWHLAFAFCIWDGGRLPTEAEWNYAAAGGAEQRVYPWGADPPDESRAVYCGPAAGSPPGVDPFEPNPCAGLPRAAGLLPVGSKSPAGDGKWGHADLAGNLAEWTQDRYFDPYTQVPCNNCANLGFDGSRVVRGGSIDRGPNALCSSYREASFIFGKSTGIRCARNPP